MSNLKISAEILKYPYCGKSRDSIQCNELLSEKICYYTIKIRGKMVAKTRRVFAYGQLIISLSTGIVPKHGVICPTLPTTSVTIESLCSDGGLSKEEIIAQATLDMSARIYFTESEIDELYYLSVECKNNSLSQEELINKIRNLRGGSFVNVAAGLAIITAIIIIANNANGFQYHPPVNFHFIERFYGTDFKPGQFGYGKGSGPRSITLKDRTQNAGSDKKPSSPGSLEYEKVWLELNRQSNKKVVEIEIGNQIYTLTNPNRDSFELSQELADQLYDSIRNSDTDICDVAENLGFKADNIKNVKEHVFYNEHDLDKYDDFERKRFDSDLLQALAWKRLENGTHTQDDVTWMKHECAERHHELKYNSGYSEAHKRAQTRFDGQPWDTQF